MFEQILEGAGRAILGMLIAGFGYGFYKLGEMQVEGYFTETGNWYANKFTAGIPKWKAAGFTFAVALILGLVASGDYVEHDGSGDGIFDPGQVVEVHENHRPYESFVQVFLFTLAASWLGVAKATFPGERGQSRMALSHRLVRGD